MVKNFYKKIKKDLARVSPATMKKITVGLSIFFGLLFLWFVIEVYIPINPYSHETITYTVQKGWGQNEIAKDLEKMGIIRSKGFFQFYALLSLESGNLQAGDYKISPKMSTYQIVKKIANGQVIKNTMTILEGWTVRDIDQYLESKGLCKKGEFIQLAKGDYSEEFSFLKEVPLSVDLEGYLFPDTYEVSKDQTCKESLMAMLENFDKKVTPDIRQEAIKQKKSLFEIITMASLIEKEVRTISDKQVVSGILWKRISVGMPLQLDATINYITGKSNPSSTYADLKIDSPYNTYKYKGLPQGPISSPGLESIRAALEPKATAYWFYLSDGRTIFSKTLEEHNANKAKYLD